MNPSRWAPDETLTIGLSMQSAENSSSANCYNNTTTTLQPLYSSVRGSGF